MGRKGGQRIRGRLRFARRLKGEKMQTYLTKGTCSRQILFDVTEDGRVENVKFIGGCSGNLQGIAKLVQGRKIDDIIDTLKGIKCKANTSCPDQLCRAIRQALES